MSCSTSLVPLDNRNARAFPPEPDSVGAGRRCRRSPHRICHQPPNIPSEPATCEIALIAYTFYFLVVAIDHVAIMFSFIFRCARARDAVYDLPCL